MTWLEFDRMLLARIRDDVENVLECYREELADCTNCDDSAMAEQLDIQRNITWGGITRGFGLPANSENGFLSLFRRRREVQTPQAFFRDFPKVMHGMASFLGLDADDFRRMLEAE